MEILLMVLIAIGVVSLVINTTVLGLMAYTVMNKIKNNRGSAVAPVPNAHPDEESQLRAKRKFEAEQEAFEELMNYSVEKAYGQVPKAEE